jgi:hypothetical protein
MKRHYISALASNTLALMGILSAATVLAQSDTSPPAPGTQPSDPSAASTPHQRATTKSPASESPAPANGASPSDSSTPHQKQVTKKKHKAKKASPDAAAAPAGP